ncbi:hypothetical protein Efla_006530 [Eimeria flavescens]
MSLFFNESFCFELTCCGLCTPQLAGTQRSSVFFSFLVLGSAAHGETWVVKNDVNAQKDELERQKAKLEEALGRLEVGIDQAAEKMAEAEEEAIEEGEDYEDDMDYAERFDPHDRQA